MHAITLFGVNCSIMLSFSTPDLKPVLQAQEEYASLQASFERRKAASAMKMKQLAAMMQGLHTSF